jgi:UDP-glucose 4-epimerase
VWGDGTAVRDFLHVEDAIDGLLAAFEKGLGAGPVNLGSGRGYAIVRRRANNASGLMRARS